MILQLSHIFFTDALTFISFFLDVTRSLCHENAADDKPQF